MDDAVVYDMMGNRAQTPRSDTGKKLPAISNSNQALAKRGQDIAQQRAVSGPEHPLQISKLGKQFGIGLYFLRNHTS